jgi:hypothetical protein
VGAAELRGKLLRPFVFYEAKNSLLECQGFE